MRISATLRRRRTTSKNTRLGSLWGAWRVELRRARQLLAAGTLEISVGPTFALAEAHRAYATARHRAEGKATVPVI